MWAGVHAVCPPAAHRTICLKNEELHQDPTCGTSLRLHAPLYPPSPTPKSGNELAEACPKGHPGAVGGGRSPPKGTNYLRRGCEPSEVACIQREGRCELGFSLLGVLSPPTRPQQPRLCRHHPAPPPDSAVSAGTLAHPTPTECNTILHLYSTCNVYFRGHRCHVIFLSLRI